MSYNMIITLFRIIICCLLLLFIVAVAAAVLLVQLLQLLLSVCVLIAAFRNSENLFVLKTSNKIIFAYRTIRFLRIEKDMLTATIVIMTFTAFVTRTAYWMASGSTPPSLNIRVE